MPLFVCSTAGCASNGAPQTYKEARSVRCNHCGQNTLQSFVAPPQERLADVTTGGVMTTPAGTQAAECLQLVDEFTIAHLRNAFRHSPQTSHRYVRVFEQ